MKMLCDNLIFVRYAAGKKSVPFYPSGNLVTSSSIFFESAKFSIFRILTKIFANKNVPSLYLRLLAFNVLQQGPKVC